VDDKLDHTDTSFELGSRRRDAQRRHDSLKNEKEEHKAAPQEHAL